MGAVVNVIIVRIVVPGDPDEQRVELWLQEIGGRRSVVDEAHFDRRARQIAGIGDQGHFRILTRQRDNDAALRLARAGRLEPARRELAGRRRALPGDRSAGPTASARRRRLRPSRRRNGRPPVGEMIVTTGGSAAQAALRGPRDLAVWFACADRLALRRASSSTSRTMSGRLKRSRKREAGKKSACCSQPRLTCQPIRSSPPGGGHVIAGRRPGDPARRRRLDEQRQQLLPVAPAQPADRAVDVSND